MATGRPSDLRLPVRIDQAGARITLAVVVRLLADVVLSQSFYYAFALVYLLLIVGLLVGLFKLLYGFYFLTFIVELYLVVF